MINYTNDMKYPEKQYQVLKESTKRLMKFIPSQYLTNINYTVFQQYSEGQPHNKLMVNKNTFAVVRAHQIENAPNKADYFPILEGNIEFELYPEGCNDTHVTTAEKRLWKELGL